MDSIGEIVNRMWGGGLMGAFVELGFKYIET